MLRSDWLLFVKFLVAAFIIFYLRVWFLESTNAGSFKEGHARLWEKPKKWQLIVACFLWGLIIIAFIVAFSMRR
jgi:RsiW-degrading membrane proteinase PrsW (M82 family)